NGEQDGDDCAQPCGGSQSRPPDPQMSSHAPPGRLAIRRRAPILAFTPATRPIGLQQSRKPREVFMRKATLLPLALCASLEVVGAQTSFVVRLDSSQEVPPTTSTATGSGTLTLNTDNTLNYDISYTNLTADFLAAHIHGPAGPGTNAAVLF